MELGNDRMRLPGFGGIHHALLAADVIDFPNDTHGFQRLAQPYLLLLGYVV